jgi:hypothetical protein
LARQCSSLVSILYIRLVADFSTDDLRHIKSAVFDKIHIGRQPNLKQIIIQSVKSDNSSFWGLNSKAGLTNKDFFRFKFVVIRKTASMIESSVIQVTYYCED